ncbi:MAG: hypothetical protein V1802_01000 [Candidatus Aenigmatarchaeota archaeon]
MTPEDVAKLAGIANKSKEEIEALAEKKIAAGVPENEIFAAVSRELGIYSVPQQKELEIMNIVPNMYRITFSGKITSMTPIREFQRDGSTGRVQNVTIEDRTGKIRFSLWNDEISKHNFNIGDSIRLENVWTRKDNFGNPEVRISSGGRITRTADVIDIPVKITKKTLAEASENDEVEIETTLTHIFERPLLYYFCPTCRAKLIGNSCMTHGDVTPTKSLIVSAMIDDGTANMNAVFFTNTAEKLFGKTTDDVERELSNTTMDEFLSSLGILSKKLKIHGTIRRSKFTNDLELLARNVERIEQ